jgi:hypothetical protein
LTIPLATALRSAEGYSVCKSKKRANLLNLLLGALLGGLVGLVLALLVQPVLEDPTRSLLVRLMSRLSLIRSRANVAGSWRFVWWQDGDVANEDEEAVHLRTIGSKVAGKFSWRGRTYQLIGSRYTPNFISGTYVDELEGNVFHGVFQLRVLPGDNLMEGRWMGFNTHQDIISGPWFLRRVGQGHYSYERSR